MYTTQGGSPVWNGRVLSYHLHRRLHDGHLTDEEEEGSGNEVGRQGIKFKTEGHKIF